MTTYHFSCTLCDMEFGVDFNPDDVKEPPCPRCKTGVNVKRVWPRSIDFSRGGAGIYKNDYK